jgi:hypothetical protein
VIILRLVGMSIGMSALMSYALRRTPVLSQQLLRPEDALDLEKTAQVALEVVTRITGEIALIALGVAVVAAAVASLLGRGDRVSAGPGVSSADPRDGRRQTAGRPRPPA